MAIGALIRSAFGPFEGVVAHWYRRSFFDLDVLADDLARRHTPRRVLEVGCGEGALLSALARRWPEARFTGIDITPRVGRLFDGDRERVTFHCVSAQVEAERAPGAYDLVLMCDVLHHVPGDLRLPLLRAVRTLMAPGARFVFKDWAPSTSVAHAMNVFSDRVLTGDRGTRYLRPAQARQALTDVFAHVDAEPRHWPPWRNNYSLEAWA